MTSIIPYLTVTNGRAAIEFYSEVFGAEIVEGELFEMDDGRLGHVSLVIGGAKLYLADEFPEVGAIAPETLGGSTAGFVIHVDNADDTMVSAISAGATLDRPVENQHGNRSGWFVDPWGHRWSPTSAASSG